MSEKTVSTGNLGEGWWYAYENSNCLQKLSVSTTTARIDRRHKLKTQKANFELLWLSFEHETTKTKTKPKQFSPNPNFLQKMRIFPSHHGYPNRIQVYCCAIPRLISTDNTADCTLYSFWHLSRLHILFSFETSFCFFLAMCSAFSRKLLLASQVIFFFSRCTGVFCTSPSWSFFFPFLSTFLSVFDLFLLCISFLPLLLLFSGEGEKQHRGETAPGKAFPLTNDVLENELTRISFLFIKDNEYQTKQEILILKSDLQKEH